jgi:protein-tyrosine phosphatase
MTAALPTFIPLENASNLRDLGGWPTQDGRRVRTGIIYRAPALLGLSPSDQAAIAALNIKITCDFRGVHESSNSPVNLRGARVEKLPIEPTVGASLRDIVLTGMATGHVSPAEMFDLLREAYQAYALIAYPRYRTMFELLLDESNHALLFHCAAGKDRTGFGAAILLAALGVDWPHILQDYLATNTLWRRETAKSLDLPDAVKNMLLSAHPDLLTAAFDALRGAYGSVDTYLERAFGLNATARAALQNKLLTA